MSSLPPSINTPPSPTPATGGESGKDNGNAKGSGGNCLVILGIVVGIGLILTLIGTVVYFYYFHASLRPTELSQEERIVAEKKMELVDLADGQPGEAIYLEPRGFEVLPPEQREEFAKLQEMERRTVSFTEREINGLLNHNTNLGENLKVQFRSGRIAMEAVIPMQEDFPMVGGKQIRASLDVSIDKNVAGDLEVVIRDVTVGGVPMPNDWMGGVKGQNLIEELSQEAGFFRAFADGIEEIQVENGEIRVRLAE